MSMIIWMVLTVLIWTNNEILHIHTENKTKPSYNFWVSAVITFIALICWFIERVVK